MQSCCELTPVANRYFLVNDTSYENHHGCQSVVRNLHLAMSQRGWRATGSSPVGASLQNLLENRAQIAEADLILVNGEGSLHHDSRNASRLLDIILYLQESHPVVLLNSVWQANRDVRWATALGGCRSVYVRDRSSLKEILPLRPDASYVPDLTFYDFPQVEPRGHHRFACTDSVTKGWTVAAMKYCDGLPEWDFLTLFTGGAKQTNSALENLKVRFFPQLWARYRLPVGQRYRSLAHAVQDTESFRHQLQDYRAVCTARYHALCFCIQQSVPFLVVASNTHKSESLVAEIGLPSSPFLYAGAAGPELVDAIAHVEAVFPQYRLQIADFCKDAKHRLANMFDEITGA